MAWVERRVTRTTQPQDTCGVDWSNENIKGLLGSWNGALRGKAAFGTDAAPQGNAVVKAGRDGVGLSNTDTGSNNFWKVDRGTTYTYTQQVTFEALIEVDVFTNVAPFISGVVAQYVQPGSSADDRGPFLRFGNGSSENRDKPFFAVMQNNTERGVLGPSLQTGRKYHMLGTYDGANVKLFIDGVLIGANATTGTFENGNNAYLAIGADYPGTSSNEFRALQGRIYLANVYGTGKTDAQAKSLADNPWQIFEPETHSIWYAELTLPRIVYPNTDVVTGDWVSSTGGALYSTLDEVTPDDADYISVNSVSSCTMRLEAAAYPGMPSQALAYRASSTQGSFLTVTLSQSNTVIMTRTHQLTGLNTLYTQTLTPEEIALIGNGAIDVTLSTS